MIIDWRNDFQGHMKVRIKISRQSMTLKGCRREVACLDLSRQAQNEDDQAKVP